MKATLILFLAILTSSIQIFGQENNSVESTGKFAVRLPEGQPHPVCIVQADNRQMQLQEAETFDGSLSWNGTLNEIDPEWVQSMAVVKGEVATSQFGSIGQNGVVLITLKAGSFKNLPPSVANKFKKVKTTRL